MRKNILPMTMAAILCVSTLSGCQKAPEASNDNGIQHAQSALEQQISDIAGETPGQQSGGFYEGTIGTTDNKMYINAEIPAIPEIVYQITLKPNYDLDMDTLTAFLDSSNGNIEDTSQELLESIEKTEYENTHDTGDGIYLYTNFGDHSALQLTDNKKEASFAFHTHASYRDSQLLDKYFGISVNTTTLIMPDQMDAGTGFTAKEAEQILLDKLKVLSITEIAFDKIWFMEGSEYSYYDMWFVPSYDGIEMISEAGGAYTVGEVYPYGGATVTPEGVALLELSDFCGRIVSKEPVAILSFEQIEKILEQYLDGNMLSMDERITMNNVKLEYYPMPNNDITYDEIEYRQELELIPIWHIYNVDRIVGSDTPHNICINAVTGKLERVW